MTFWHDTVFQRNNCIWQNWNLSTISSSPSDSDLGKIVHGREWMSEVQILGSCYTWAEWWHLSPHDWLKQVASLLLEQIETSVFWISDYEDLCMCNDICTWCLFVWLLAFRFACVDIGFVSFVWFQGLQSIHVVFTHLLVISLIFPTYSSCIAFFSHPLMSTLGYRNPM